MRLILIWNLFKYGWPFMLIGGVILGVLISIFGDPIESDVGVYLVVGYFIFIAIGAFYRWWTEPPTSEQALATAFEIVRQANEQDVFGKYLEAVDKQTQWTCIKCGATLSGTSWCRNDSERRSMDIDLDIMDRAVVAAATAGDTEAFNQGKERLQAARNLRLSTKHSEEKKRIEESTLSGKRFCTNCGTSISQSMKFCPNCGTRIT